MNQHPSNTSQNSMPQYPGNTPGPPFHKANVTLNFEPKPIPGYDLPQANKQSNLAQRERSANHERYTPGSTDYEGTEMDLSVDDSVDQPSPATLNSQSHGNSTSQSSSYSPGQHQDEIPNLQYRPSPKTLSSHSSLPHSATSHINNQYFATNDDMFPTPIYDNTALMNGDSLNGGFISGNDWELAGAGTGMTPMSDGNWNHLLETTLGISGGWDPIGTPHGAVIDSRFGSSHAE